MHPRHLYFLLCLLGIVLPFAVFTLWLRVHGLDLRLFVTELLSTRIGTFFGLDVLVSAAALLALIRVEYWRRPCATSGCPSSPRSCPDPALLPLPSLGKAGRRDRGSPTLSDARRV